MAGYEGVGSTIMAGRGIRGLAGWSRGGSDRCFVIPELAVCGREGHGGAQRQEVFSATAANPGAK